MGLLGKTFAEEIVEVEEGSSFIRSFGFALFVSGTGAPIFSFMFFNPSDLLYCTTGERGITMSAKRALDDWP